MECIKMELGEPDASGRRSPVEIKGSEYVLDVDMVVMAIGQGPNPLLKQTTPELETNKRGNIVANEEGATSIPGVFAGGDIVNWCGNSKFLLWEPVKKQLWQLMNICQNIKNFFL